jgi:hypothetical protein
VKLEMKEKLEQENLVCITIDKQHTNWQTDHEMLIDGKLFDVQSAEEKDGQLIVRGLFDETETAIDAKLKTLNKQSTNSHESQILQAFFQTVLFCNDLHSIKTAMIEFELPNNFNLFIQPEHLPFSPGNFTPPPEA